MIRSRRSRGVGAALLAAYCRSSHAGRRARTRRPTRRVAVGVAREWRECHRSSRSSGGGSGPASTIATPFTGSCTRYSDNVPGAPVDHRQLGVRRVRIQLRRGQQDHHLHGHLQRSLTGWSTPASAAFTTPITTAPCRSTVIRSQPSPPAMFPPTIRAIRQRSRPTTPSFFQTGTNTLTFVVTDVGSVTGLEYSATINYDTLPGPVDEPARHSRQRLGRPQLVAADRPRHASAELQRPVRDHDRRQRQRHRHDPGAAVGGAALPGQHGQRLLQRDRA